MPDRAAGPSVDMHTQTESEGSELRTVEVRAAGAGEGVVCEHCEVADGALMRLRGLMGRPSLPQGQGLLLKPAPSIHTFFMRFAIDAVFLDAHMQVVGVSDNLRPWRTAGRRGARAVLELAAGEARRLGVITGMQLELAGTPSAGSRRGRGGSDGS